jgi:CBS domain containing-hemolysin-like protein
MTTAVLVALGATALATAAAAADSAVTAADEEAGEPPSGPGGARREHRVLSFTKVAAQLTAGASAARAIGAADGIDARSGLAIALVLVGLLVLEAIARSIGAATASATTRWLHWLAPICGALLAVYLVPAARLDAWLRRLLAPPPRDAESREETSEQFRAVVSAEADVSGPGARFLAGALSLGDTVVSDVMVPRVDIVGIDVATPWSEMVDTLRRAEHARLPAYSGTIDEIRGVLYAKDVLASVIDEAEPSGGWHALVRPATFVPATKPLNVLLADFRAGRTHLVLVLDEYGGTAGLVTIENVLEEIVGEIRDEHDVEEPEVSRREAGRIWLSGRASLADLGSLVGHEFESDDNVTTVGGWVLERLGRVPQPGEEFLADGFRVVVERVRRRAVDRVYFERTTSADEASPAA